MRLFLVLLIISFGIACVFIPHFGSNTWELMAYYTSMGPDATHQAGQGIVFLWDGFTYYLNWAADALIAQTTLAGSSVAVTMLKPFLAILFGVALVFLIIGLLRRPRRRETDYAAYRRKLR